MLKWLLTLVLAIFLLGLLSPWLGRMGRLPGDLRIRRGERVYAFPFASTLVLSLLLWLVTRLL